MKRLLFIQQHAPHGTFFGREGLDAILMGSAFASCQVLLLGDGCFQLSRHQDTTGLDIKNYAMTYGALADYGVESIYVSATDLAQRNLPVDDLILPVVSLSDEEIRTLISNHDAVLSF